MPLPTLPSKLVWERVRLEFDFTLDMEFLESILSWEVTVVVQVGVDSAPQNMLASRRFLDGQRVFQWFIQGLPGVIYRLTASAVGSTGKVYKLERTLAVLPCPQVFPPLFGVVYTTTIYPVEIIEALSSNGLVTSGLMFNTITEALDSVGLLTSGSLVTPLVTYIIPPEALNSVGILTSGSLVTPLVSTSMLPEALDSIGVINSGSLQVILVSYTNYPAEALDSNGVITGGSLT